MTKNEVRDIDREREELDRQVAKLEAEKAGLPEPLSWDELQQAGALQRVEEAERRRGVIPKLLAAARIKRSQLQLSRLAADKEPVNADIEKLYAQKEALHEQIRDLETERGQIHHAWSNARFRLQRIEEDERATRRQLRELGGGS
jgi:chromosome segregation ATPase